MLFAGFTMYMLNIFPVGILFTNLLINIIYLTLTILLVSSYFALKNRRFVNIFTEMFGIGDLLFLLSVAVVFNITGFIFYIIASSLFALGMHYALRRFAFYNDKNLIPLAGLQSLFLMLLFPLMSYLRSQPFYAHFTFEQITF